MHTELIRLRDRNILLRHGNVGGCDVESSDNNVFILNNSTTLQSLSSEQC